MRMKLQSILLVTQGDPVTKTTKYRLECSGLSSSSGKERSFVLELSEECRLMIDEESGPCEIVFLGNLLPSTTSPTEPSTSQDSQSAAGHEETSEQPSEIEARARRIAERHFGGGDREYKEGDPGEFIAGPPPTARKVGVDQAAIEAARRQLAEGLQNGTVERPAEDGRPKPLKRNKEQ